MPIRPLRDEHGRRPFTADDSLLMHDPASKDLVLFHEHFHGDTGRGLGASHQTGWTALVVRCIENLAAGRRVPVAHEHTHVPNAVGHA